MDRIRSECPDVRWVRTVPALGPHDYLDVFLAPDVATASKVSRLMARHAESSADLWTAEDCPETLSAIVPT
jgi:hypothetical protein